MPTGTWISKYVMISGFSAFASYTYSRFFLGGGGGSRERMPVVIALKSKCPRLYVELTYLNPKTFSTARFENEKYTGRPIFLGEVYHHHNHRHCFLYAGHTNSFLVNIMTKL